MKNKKTIILGLNAYHGDSSACLVIDGVLVAAAEEERFNRVKHWAGFPLMSIQYCLREAGIVLSDVNHISINQNSNSNFVRKFLFLLKNKLSISFVLDKYRNKKARNNIKSNFKKFFELDKFHGNFHYIEHHYSHLASSFFVSPFRKSVVVSIDGFGDFSSSAWGFGDGSKIIIDQKIYFPHSLGVFYQAITQWLGFNNYGDEYKVMGLAPYGEGKYLHKMKKIVKLKADGSFELNLDFFLHFSEKISFEWNNCSPHIGILYSNLLIDLLGCPRKKNEEITQYHKDIAKSCQLMFEDAFFNLLNALYEKYRIDNLCLSGGCAMNSVANGKILLKTPFKNVYIPPASGDAGGSVGSAFSVWNKYSEKRSFIMRDAYFGPSFSNKYIDQVLRDNKQRLLEASCFFHCENNESLLFSLISKALADGKVIGWFQGRMEWGPRSLGNRSIIADPRRPDMKDILNKKIKKRESFRPFAPSIMREHVNEWFEQDTDVPFMMQVFKIKEDKRKIISAVTHVDGSGRLQTVDKKYNAKYYNLISSFYNLTGVPILINTSFNESEPIVCSPEEALNCFLRTNMDILVLEDWIIERNETLS